MTYANFALGRRYGVDLYYRCRIWRYGTRGKPAALFDVRNSLLFAFLVISDQNTTVAFFSKCPPVAILDIQS
jgi:hypothetical protein